MIWSSPSDAPAASVLAASVCAQTAPEPSKKITEPVAIDLDDRINIAFLKLFGYFARDRTAHGAGPDCPRHHRDAGHLKYGAFVFDETSADSRYILRYIATADEAIHRHV